MVVRLGDAQARAVVAGVQRADQYSRSFAAVDLEPVAPDPKDAGPAAFHFEIVGGARGGVFERLGNAAREWVGRRSGADEVAGGVVHGQLRREQADAGGL